MKKTKVLFVCMGNICRSPTAHAVMQYKVMQLGLDDQILVDSAGTHAYHIGERADSRSTAMAMSRGVDMDAIRARKVSVHDYDHFDYILAMDQDNLDLLHYYAPDNYSASILLFLEFANRVGSTAEAVVPDPYYGGDQGFEHVFELISQGCDALIEHIING